MTGAPITITLGAGEDPTLALVQRFGVAVLRGAERGLARGMLLAENHAIRNKMQGQVIGTRSRTLIRSVISGARLDARGAPVGFIGIRADSPAAKFAAIQHEGTVGKGGRFPDITPRRASALAVPLSSALDARGIAIFSGPRDPAIAGSLFKIDRGGKPPLLAREGPGGGVEPLFILLQRVALRPRPFLREAVEERIGRILAKVSESVTKEIGRS